MNTLKIKLVLLIAVISFASCKNENKEVTVTENTQDTQTEEKAEIAISETNFKSDATAKVWDSYLSLKEALVKTDASEAAAAANNLATNIAVEHDSLKQLATEIANSEDVEKQREVFSKLTSEIGNVFKEELEKGTIYQQFCPMAFNNEGGYWYSDVEQIKNPYFGNKMLKCGKVTETITK